MKDRFYSKKDDRWKEAKPLGEWERELQPPPKPEPSKAKYNTQSTRTVENYWNGQQ